MEKENTSSEWLFFQMSETGSSKVASQSCSDSGNFPGDPDKLSQSQECKYPKFETLK